MPVLHRGNRFNCRVLAINGKIIMIRPKLYLASDGNYRENRYFIAWHGPRHVEEYYLPPMMQDLQGSIKVPIGDAVISTPDTCLGAETCEELFTVCFFLRVMPRPADFFANLLAKLAAHRHGALRY